MVAAVPGNLNGFVGADPNGLWTLYFADQAAGDQMTLNSFNLSITAVPEPTTWGLLGFAVLFGGVGAVRSQKTRKQMQYWRTSVQLWLDAR